ncbi:MAG: tryptophan synthase subunit alpha [Acidobacteriota bacterium]
MFASRSLIPFVTAGHPDLEATRDIAVELARAGAALIEIGIPFSDPVADGPTIQRSSFDALRHGYTMDDYLAAVREIRRKTSVPLIFMSYLNPLLRYGLARLDDAAESVGLDGLLISDLTPEEAPTVWGDWGAPRHLKTVYLVAPTTTPDRLAAICSTATGFIYLVSRTGVTGARTALGETLRDLVAKIRRHTTLPVAVGFGIRAREDVERVWDFADGAVVGSALVEFIEHHRGDRSLPAACGRFLTRLLPEPIPERRHP